jgi:hypothetical protein
VDTTGRPGRLSKSVEVWTNDPINKMTMLTVAGEVVATSPSESGQSGGSVK